MYGHGYEVVKLSWHPERDILASGEDSSGYKDLDSRVLIWNSEPSLEETINQVDMPNGDIWSAFFEKNNQNIRSKPISARFVGEHSKSKYYLVSWNYRLNTFVPNEWDWLEDGTLTTNDNSAIDSVNPKKILPKTEHPDGKRELFWLNKGKIISV